MTDTLGERLSRANPVVDVAVPEAERAALLAAVLRAAPASPPPSRRPPARPSAGPVSDARSLARRLRRGGIAAAVVLAVGAGAAGAAEKWFSARTGVDSATVEGGHGGEILRTDAPDINAIIDAMAERIPLPPGGSFDDFKARNAAAPTRESEVALRASLEFVASCQWTGWWLHAYARRDATEMTRAQRVLAAIPNWPGTKAATYPGDRPVERDVADAALRRDPALPRRFFRANCTPRGT